MSTTTTAPVLLGDADLSAVGALLADPGRCRMLLALADGRELAATMLAEEAGVSAATGSAHLRKPSSTAGWSRCVLVAATATTGSVDRRSVS